MKGELVLSQYVVPSEPLSDAGAHYPRRVLFSTRTARPLLVSESVWFALLANDIARLPEDLRQALVAQRILVKPEEDELAEIIEENKDAIRSDKQLFHVIQPSAACQLGCGYCGQQHSAKHLSEKDQDLLLERLGKRMRSGRYSGLSISWFGAEPLLGLPVMRNCSPKLRSLAVESQASYSAAIVTNGVLLTREVALELQGDHGVIKAEVTLDGPKAVHDARRMTKKNRPSFDTILTNLCAIRDDEKIVMELIVRCNVDRQNYQHVTELIDLLAELKLSRRVTFYVSPVYSWGNEADRGALEASDFAQLEVEWLAQLFNRGFSVGILPPRKKIVCLAVQEEGELTDAFGDVFNCTEVSYVPAYGSPNKYRISGLRDESSNAPFRNFNQEILDGGHQSCRSCRMLPVCGGSCPKLWQEGKSPCPSAKLNIQERLALWYAMEKTASR